MQRVWRLRRQKARKPAPTGLTLALKPSSPPISCGRTLSHLIINTLRLASSVIKANISVDWMHRDSARANIRRHVKRLLRKYGYPPDLQDAAVQNVLQQAEALSLDWAA